MTLRLRLLLAFGYVLLLVVIALEVPLATNLSRRVNSEIESESNSQAQLLAATLAGRIDGRVDLSRPIQAAARDLRGRVIVVDREGRLRTDSAGSGLANQSYASRPEIAAALRGEPTQGTRRSDSLEQELLYTTAPIIEPGGEISGAIRVTQSVEGVRRSIRNDILALVAVGLVAIGFGLIVAWVIAGSISQPLHALARTARRIASGSLNERAVVVGTREQRELALTFNEMTDRLQTALKGQQEFVANASHQLRTPLTGLRLRLEAAGLKTEREEIDKELIAAEQEADRLTGLLSQLLLLAREGERPEAQATSLEKAVQSAVERWLPTTRVSGHRLTPEIGTDSTVLSTEADLAMVLDNLIENATKYAPGGTEIRIATGERDGLGAIRVIDQGPGIAPTERERIFDRFFRGEVGKKKTSGTGLGLAVVAALVRRWRGKLVVEDAPGGGSSFEAGFPLTAGSATAVNDSESDKTRAGDEI